ncbi:MAG TPA: DUF4145 domain-containing protein [Ktedonobacteraceae bacterium]|nr:DUF4145 domain-containing protein [Ktedonobacteraceae bacterium]
MIDEKVVMQCGHCRNRTVFNMEGEYIHKVSPEGGLLPENVYDVTTWRIMQCLTCSQPTLEQISKTIEEKYYHTDEESREWEELLSEPETKILYPTDTIGITPHPSTDMPEDVAKDFNEARSVFSGSPRSSAALLRLAVQKLCKCLGQSGKKINDDIAALVKAGLTPRVQKALDIVRVIGNNAVHPGEIDLE